jgi:hypothetical protein
MPRMPRYHLPYHVMEVLQKRCQLLGIKKKVK